MPALLTDLYQLTMLDAYLREGMQETAVFELFVRKLPPQRHFLVMAGLEQALEWLQTLAFDEADGPFFCLRCARLNTSSIS